MKLAINLFDFELKQIEIHVRTYVCVLTLYECMCKLFCIFAIRFCDLSFYHFHVRFRLLYKLHLPFIPQLAFSLQNTIKRTIQIQIQYNIMLHIHIYIYHI